MARCSLLHPGLSANIRRSLEGCIFYISLPCYPVVLLTIIKELSDNLTFLLSLLMNFIPSISGTERVNFEIAY